MILFQKNLIQKNNNKIKSLNIKDKIQNILDKSDDKNKRMKMEGKILIYNISYIKKEKSNQIRTLRKNYSKHFYTRIN